MRLVIRQNCLLLFCLAVSAAARSQTGPLEFPKEFIMHARLSTGLIAPPHVPELFVGSLELRPQWTLVEHKLRGGLVAGGFYTARTVYGLGGLTVSYKLSEFTGGYFGSLGNLHLNFDHLWGGADQRLVGAGINLDLLNKLVVGLGGYRDYHFGQWWWTSSIAFRISKVKKPIEDFPH